MSLNTEHLEKCLETLKFSFEALKKATKDSAEYNAFRNASLKGFELTLEVSGKLLKKALKAFLSNPRTVDKLTFKEVLRHAAKHGLLTLEAAERWFEYRDNRNTTAHDYDENAAETALELIPSFIKDVESIIESINNANT